MAATKLSRYLLLLLLVLIRLRFSSAKEEFHEELLVKPFPTGEVLTYFQFTTLWDVQIYDNDACKFVPSAKLLDVYKNIKLLYS